MNKRYQVFVSSTFQDLQEERNRVLHGLLDLDCIPCGMEYFPASSDSQWDYIKKLIDDCDYYVVVVAGRYGSMDSEGKSYTQKEYEYAASKGIPIIAFIHSDISSIQSGKVDIESDRKEKLQQFIVSLQTRLCKPWTTADELSARVITSITHLIKSHPRTGWVKADTVDETAHATMVGLYKRIGDLEGEIKAKETRSSSAYIENDTLSQGSDTFTFSIRYSIPDGIYESSRSESVTWSWDKIASCVLPMLLTIISDSSFSSETSYSISVLLIKEGTIPKKSFGCKINDHDMNSLKIQLLALGYIELTNGLVALTSNGQQKLFEQRAIRRPIQ